MNAVGLEGSRRRHDGAGDIGDLHQAEVHLEEGEAQVHPRLQSPARLGATGPFGISIAIEAHLVAELAAQHLVDRDSIGLAGKIPQSDLDTRDPAALPSVTAELLDAAEQAIDVARILAEQSALEHQGIGGAGAIAHFAQPHYPLIGIDLDECRREWRAHDLGDPQVGNAQRARMRGRTDIVFDSFGGRQYRHDFLPSGRCARSLPVSPSRSRSPPDARGSSRAQVRAGVAA